MRWQRRVGCLLGATFLAAVPSLTQAAGSHNGGGGAPGGSKGGSPGFGGGRGLGGSAFHGNMAPGRMAPGNWNHGNMAPGHMAPGNWNHGNWNHGNWNHGNWNHRNWAQGNWNHGNWHHHGHFRDDEGQFFFSTGFGFSGWGYPWYWDYPPYYYPYYYPYPYDYPYYYPYDDAYYGINGSPSYSYQTSAAGADTAVQIALWRRGYYRGPIDGVIGPASRAAIRSFQAGNRIPVTGTVDRSLLQALRVRAPI